MGKQISERIRKTLSILLLVLFVASLAASSVSAAASVKHGDKSMIVMLVATEKDTLKDTMPGLQTA